MALYVKKYTGNNYFTNRDAVDRIKIELLPADAFPRFRYETEDYSTLGTYRGGDFDVTISLLNTETSVLGKTIREFFLGENRNYFYLFILEVGEQTFSGIAQQSQITGDFTYSQNKYEITAICKDMLIEWSKKCSTVPNSTIGFPNNTLKTFEEYMNLHFAGITNDVVILSLPDGTYLSRLGGSPAGCWAAGDYRNFITNQQSISRWETFKELAKGLGFNFEMYLNPGTQELASPEFIFRIFFIDDIGNETPIDIDIVEHNEFTTEARLDYLYFKYRYFSLAEAQYSDGIFFNSLESWGADTNHGDGVTLYPSLPLTLGDKVLSYINGSGTTEKTVLRDVDFKEFELKQYPYSFTSGGAIGKLYSPTESLASGISYARIFNCWTGSGTNIDKYNFLPIQNYAIKNYRRFLKGIQKAKSLKVVFDENTNIKTWKPVILNDGFGDEKYYISAVRNIDLTNRTAVIEALKIS